MSNNKENLKDLWKKETEARHKAQGWETLADAGFIGLVATEMPEFFAKEGAKKSAWRLPLFITSGASVIVGEVMKWIRRSKADALRESTLMIEHTSEEQSISEPGQWSAKIAAQKENPPRISK